MLKRAQRSLCLPLAALSLTLTLELNRANAQEAPLKAQEQKPVEIDKLPPEAQDKLISIGIEDYNRRIDARFALFAHKRTFVMPISYVRNPNTSIYAPILLEEENKHEFYTENEAEFQLSFFLPVVRGLFGTNWDLLASYTHHSWWQVYNAHWSKPFRETNYNPELFSRHIFTDQPKLLGVTLIGLDAGYMHESNGQIQLMSRSWNRLFARTMLAKGSYSAILSTWYRLPEKRRDDDNPDISRYMGYGKFELNKSIGKPTLATVINLAERPGVEASVSYPFNNSFRWFIKVNRGYGQSLIEYDRNTTRYGAGFTLEGYSDNR